MSDVPRLKTIANTISVSFRRKSNLNTQWRQFVARHADAVAELQRLAYWLETPDRFDDLLQHGNLVLEDSPASLNDLSAREWQHLRTIVASYSVDWQSYFVRTMYVAYYAEHDRRCADGVSPDS
ncbi:MULTISPECIES: hypothetical protein [Rhodopirellula]|uniref:hypothetical protein n=1 Tax=Rhodopirellula TaxID=265488 RepID=UPI0025797A84|nr:hypothetical protein [Rhodopirellula sp. UBA1907]